MGAIIQPLKKRNFAAMKKMVFSILFIFSALFTDQVKGQTLTTETSPISDPIEANLKGYYSQEFGLNMSDIFDLNLYSAIEKWLGTPYRYAGNTLKGIDCSGFVKDVYEAAFCFFLPRNSIGMYQSVQHLTKDQLEEGDLVFFRINRRKTISHVGVYLGNNKFAHASRSKGVIISDLNHPYYKRYFVKGGRVEFQTN